MFADCFFKKIILPYDVMDFLDDPKWRITIAFIDLFSLTYTYLDCLLGVKMRGHKIAEI